MFLSTDKTSELELAGPIPFDELSGSSTIGILVSSLSTKIEVSLPWVLVVGGVSRSTWCSVEDYVSGLELT